MTRLALITAALGIGILIAQDAGARGQIAPRGSSSVSQRARVAPKASLAQTRAVRVRRGPSGRELRRQATTRPPRIIRAAPRRGKNKATVAKTSGSSKRIAARRTTSVGRKVTGRRAPMRQRAAKQAARQGLEQRRHASRTRPRVSTVARVRALSARSFDRRSRAVVQKLNGGERRQATQMLRSNRVRSSNEARHAVLAYLRLRSARGGAALPISLSQMTSMVGSKSWSPRRMANLALILKQASIIARKDKISVKQAFDKALKINGIYKQYYSGVCGA